MTDRDEQMRAMGVADRILRVALDVGWAATVGLEVWPDEGDDELLRGRLAITERVCQPMGLVHGGIYGCVGEELASVGTARQVVPQGKWTVGMSNNTSFFRPGTLGGELRAVARPIHRGRTTWVWDVEISDEHDRLCARSTVTMAVREGPPPAPPT